MSGRVSPQAPTEDAAVGDILSDVNFPGVKFEAITEDDDGHFDPTSTATITVSLQTNPGGATLSGTLSRAAVAGVATFDDVRIDEPGIGYVLRFDATDKTGLNGSLFNVTGTATFQVIGSFDAKPSQRVLDYRPHSRIPDCSVDSRTADYRAPRGR